MNYQKIFNPPMSTAIARQSKADAGLDKLVGDRRDGAVYLYNDEIVLAVNVALATGRPLLVRGPSGCGKSSLARNVAGHLGWRYYEKVISSRTQARDLLWEVDLLRRLQDAQAKQLQRDFTPYITPGVLWWAFDRKSARRRGATPQAQIKWPEPDEPGGGSDHWQAVVLLDEIDKADPDVPNNLLVPLGSLRFRVDETGVEISAHRPPLLMLTTNDERELPVAFLRRCVELKLRQPTRQELVNIGQAHFGADHVQLLEKVAELVAPPAVDEGALASAAEYLDTVRACLRLKVTPDSTAWEMLAKATVWKHGRTAAEQI